MSHATRPRSAGWTFLAISVALLILLTMFALTNRQPPPPAIAEFAPQAVDNITDAPTDQAGRSGLYEVGASRQDQSEVPTPTPLSIDVPRVRRCVGDPPRQIEDPQSPPCVPYWTGENGGATYRGVTKDQIRVIVGNPDSASAERGKRVADDLNRFFNTRFEFYGRQLTFLPPSHPGQYSGDCKGRRAGAVAAVEQTKAFAILNWGGNQAPCFAEEAARRRLVTMDSDGAVSDDNLFTGRPFLWQYRTGIDEIYEHWGRWACKRLAGQPAEYAPDVTYRGVARKFGALIHSQQTPYGVDLGPLRRELGRCGVQLAHEAVAYANDNEIDDFEQQTANAVIAMKAKGVTTAFVSTGFVAAPAIPATASAQAYFPEWVLNDGMAPNVFVRSHWGDSSQRRSLMGVMVGPETVPYPDVAMNWALQEVDPGFKLDTYLAMASNVLMYRSLLLLASGIQLAGPKLTPETLEHGLLRTQFPNPSTPPVQEGWVGFPSGRHSFIHDAAVVWWSETSPSAYADDGVGTWCYAEGGKRYKVEEWTARDAAVFTPHCDSHPAGLR